MRPQTKEKSKCSFDVGLRFFNTDSEDFSRPETYCGSCASWKQIRQWSLVNFVKQIKMRLLFWLACLQSWIRCLLGFFWVLSWGTDLNLRVTRIGERGSAGMLFTWNNSTHPALAFSFVTNCLFPLNLELKEAADFKTSADFFCSLRNYDGRACGQFPSGTEKSVVKMQHILKLPQTFTCI